MIERGRSVAGLPLGAVDGHLATYQDIHRELLGADWSNSATAKNHPATERLSLAASSARVDVPGVPDEPVLPTLGRLILDAHVWQKSGEDTKLDSSRDDGVLGRVLSPEKQRMVQSRARDASQYEDVLVELGAAAWYISNGWNVSMNEAPGQADMQVARDDGDVVWSVECKHLRGKSPHSLTKIIKKASSQLRRSRPHDRGILQIHVGAMPVERVVEPRWVPKEIRALGDRAAHCAQGGKNRGVDAIVLVWDDWLLITDRGDPEVGNVVYRRRPYVAEPPVVYGREPPEIMNHVFSGFEIEFQLGRTG